MKWKIFAIIKREFITRAKTKGFIIGTLLFPLLLIFIFAGIFIFSALVKPSSRTYYVIDQTGIVYNEFVRMLPDTLKNGDLKYRFIDKTIAPEELDARLAEFQKQVFNKEIYGYLVIPADLLESREVRFSARNVSDFDELSEFERALSRIVTNHRLEQMGLSASEIREQFDQGHVNLVSSQVTATGEVQKSAGASFILTYILAYILLILTMVYGQILMRSVIEEKSQRITETILSSISPMQLLGGKIIGICLLGMTQLFIVGLMLLALVAYGETLLVGFGVNIGELLEIMREINFSATIFGFMLYYFIIGFVFFAGLFAAVGAIVNSEDEGQQFQMPLIIIIMIGYFMVFTVTKNPDTSSAFWISMIPFYTPLLMFARIAVSDPVLPSGAYLSIFTMLGFTALTIWISSRIYRVGILMYGKKPSLKEAVRWIRYK